MPRLCPANDPHKTNLYDRRVIFDDHHAVMKWRYASEIELGVAMIGTGIRALFFGALTCGLGACVSPTALMADSASGCPDQDVALEGPCASQALTLSANDIQAVGSHNSYKIAIPAPELAMIAASSPEAAEGLDYGHLPLRRQLDMGMRQLELDVIRDPEGGRFSNPLLPRLTTGLPDAVAYDPSGMDVPGYKVLHSQDVDVRSHCISFAACLSNIDSWSLEHPDHVPLLILINLKSGSLGIPGTVDALDFDADAFDALDAEVRAQFVPERLITPDQVRGKAATLRDGVLSGGWPSLEASRGRLILALDANAADVETYLRNKPSLEGLPLFVNSISDAADHAAYFTMNDPLRDQAKIKHLVERGFLVRTRADADTREARLGDVTRRDAAFESGAQYISTDYYQSRAEWSDYSVVLPGGQDVRCNPVRAYDICVSEDVPEQ